jgi:hypothetical protein
MMKQHLWLSLFLLLVASFAQAKDAPSTPHYLDPTTVDLKALLGDPPADGSPQTLQEINLLLEKQKNRTPEEVARAQKESKMTAFIFADVLGDWFDPKNLPVTAQLLNNVEEDTHTVSESAKKIWGRPRPPLQDKRIQPVVEVPTTASYPSGHSTRGTIFALVIAELTPDLRDKILARGQLIGEDRMIGGVHFPSDVAAGRVLGKALFDIISKDDHFQADLAKAKLEIGSARPKVP